MLQWSGWNRSIVCGGLWFEEPVVVDAFAAAQTASFDAEVFLVIGTLEMVAPAATLPMTARGQGAILVDINPEESVLARRAQYRLRGPASAILPALYAATWGTSKLPRRKRRRLVALIAWLGSYESLLLWRCWLHWRTEAALVRVDGVPPRRKRAGFPARFS